MKQTYLDATQESGKAFFMRKIEGPVVMLNLLKYNDIADYSTLPDIAPDKEISGAEAYQLYIDHTLPFLKEAGSEVIFWGKGGQFLIGPEAEQWDAVMLVKHASTERFMAFAQQQDYLKGAGHRTAALADSRLLPIEQMSELKTW